MRGTKTLLQKPGGKPDIDHDVDAGRLRRCKQASGPGGRRRGPHDQDVEPGISKPMEKIVGRKVEGRVGDGLVTRVRWVACAKGWGRREGQGRAEQGSGSARQEKKGK